MVRPAIAPTVVSRSESDRDLERLGDRIAELAAHLHAGTFRLLVMIRDFDAKEGWRAGFRTCAHWLSWRTGIDLGAAREKVRVARALEDLPTLSEAMRRGELSYSKARALTRVATVENEKELMGFARHGTASHVETLVRTWRRVNRLADQHDERERHRTRFLTVRPDLDGMYVVRGRLDPEVGALLLRALEAAGEVLYRSAADTAGSVAPTSAVGAVPSEVPVEGATTGQRRADAIGLLAERALRGELVPAEGARTAPVSRADRFQVVLHVGGNALRDSESLDDAVATRESDLLSNRFGPHESGLEDGVHVSAETSRRVACDASRVVMTHGTDGSVLDVGRKTRTVPPAIRRALDRRDRGCRFPGCGLPFCDAHHIEHWADGGETRLDNLVLLCRLHHRAVHEEEFKVAIAHSGEIRFRWPDGRALPDAPTAPRLPHEPAAALEREHETMKLAIDSWTPTALWQGEAFDLDHATETLRNV